MSTNQQPTARVWPIAVGVSLTLCIILCLATATIAILSRGTQFVSPLVSPAPTFTHAPTQRPTNTPVPTATVVPTATSEAQGYLRAVQESSARMGESMRRFGNLPEDPLLNEWMDGARAEATLWKQEATKARALTAPPGFASFHEYYMKGIDELDQAADHIFAFMKSRGPDFFELTQAQSHIKMSTFYLQNAAYELKKLK
jgi:hypothetical protein